LFSSFSVVIIAFDFWVFVMYWYEISTLEVYA
jgi:hypothetical protein